MPKLYEICNEIDLLIAQNMGENGEIPEDIAEKLDLLEIDKEAKALDVARYIKGVESDVKAIRDEEKILAKRRKTLENKSESLRDYLTKEVSGLSLKSANVVISWSKSKRCIVNVEPEELPEQFQKVNITADTTAIKKQLENGAKYDFAEIQEVNNLQIK